MSEKLVTIAKYTFPHRAYILKGRLQSEGIECYILNDSLRYSIHTSVVNGIELRIKEEDVPKAIEIIKDIRHRYGDDHVLVEEKDVSIKRILVPVDFSEYSNNACQYALNVAEKYNAEIMIFHSIFNLIGEPIPFADTEISKINLGEVYKKIEEDAKKDMDNLFNSLKAQIKDEKREDIKINYSLESGIAGDEILRKCKDYDPSLIIMGTKGKNATHSKFFGSVTTRITEDAGIPVLVIPEDTKYSSPNEENIRNVLYLTEFDESDFNSIHKLIAFISPFKVKLSCLNIDVDKDQFGKYLKIEELKEYFNKEYKESKVTFHSLSDENIIEKIDNFVKNNDIDIIALTTLKQGILQKLFFPDLTHKMLFHTNKPLLIFHEK